MTSVPKVLAGRVALAGALLTLACQKDGQALFDNGNLAEPSAGSSGTSPGGSQSSGGDAATAGSSTGGSAADAGEGGSGAAAGSGSGGTNEGGSAGSGTAGSGGKGEEGGSAGTAMAGSAGSGGTKPDPEPEPVTIKIDAFEDSYVDSCSSFSTFGDSERITLDADQSNCVTQALLRVALAEIPEGALVSAATLTLQCIDAGGLINVSYASEAWTEDGVRWSNRPEAGEAIGTMVCEELGPVTFDLKAAVVAWLGGQSNYGFYLRTETDAGTDFASSEADDADMHPVLSVTYTLPLK